MIHDKVNLYEVDTIGVAEDAEDSRSPAGKCADVMGVLEETMSALVTEKVMLIVPDSVFVG